MHALKENVVSTERLCFIIFDEADKLMEEAFLEQIDAILELCTSQSLHSVRKAMFSATIPSGVEALGRSIMGVDVVRLIVGQKDAGAPSTIAQKLIFAGTEDGKLATLRNLITRGEVPPPALIFVQSVERAQQLTAELALDGHRRVDTLHADLAMSDRDALITRFANGEILFLVSTDVGARGLDFLGIESVLK